MNSETAKTPPLMIRAEITGQEWDDLRVLAIKSGVTVQRFVGDLIRERLEREAS